ncbi:DUF4158 domain-containing protein [Streptomyces sp. NPDC048623]|uniref:DUF4158 domain-containing protein n=1 Tax=Streptomyces sp. NPDC048623 TaxID=3155761 RepID=UPI003420205A
MSLLVTSDYVCGGVWAVTSIERTAYPRFKRLITAHELHLFFAPSRDEVEWATARTDCDGHLLSLLLALKSYQRMGCFPKMEEIPDPVVEFVRRVVDLPDDVVPTAANRTAEWQRTAVRQRTGLIYDKAKARKIAEAVMRSEAVVKNRPADLINIALEKVVEAGLELPGFTTLDALAAKVRTEVNASICMGIYDQLSEAHRARLLALLTGKDASGTTEYNRLKQSGKAPTWSHLREQVARLEWVDALGETEVWLDGVAPGKITDFAGEADAADAPALRDYTEVKRLALLVCLVHKGADAGPRRADDDVLQADRIAGQAGQGGAGEHPGATAGPGRGVDRELPHSAAAPGRRQPGPGRPREGPDDDRRRPGDDRPSHPGRGARHGRRPARRRARARAAHAGHGRADAGRRAGSARRGGARLRRIRGPVRADRKGRRPPRQLLGGAAVRAPAQGPLHHVRPDQPPGTDGDVRGQSGPGRARTRPHPQAPARLPPRTVRGRPPRRRLVRHAELAEGRPRQEPARRLRAQALRGDGVRRARRGTAHR